MALFLLLTTFLTQESRTPVPTYYHIMLFRRFDVMLYPYCNLHLRSHVTFFAPLSCSTIRIVHMALMILTLKLINSRSSLDS